MSDDTIINDPALTYEERVFKAAELLRRSEHADYSCVLSALNARGKVVPVFLMQSGEIVLHVELTGDVGRMIRDAMLEAIEMSRQ